jgi:hypothetical protein
MNNMHIDSVSSFQLKPGLELEIARITSCFTRLEFGARPSAAVLQLAWAAVKIDMPIYIGPFLLL